jgi:hypothetical protein
VVFVIDAVMDNFRDDRLAGEADDGIDCESKARHADQRDDFFAQVVGFCVINGEWRKERPDNAYAGILPCKINLPENSGGAKQQAAMSIDFIGFDDGVIYQNSDRMRNSIKVSSKEELSWLM